MSAKNSSATTSKAPSASPPPTATTPPRRSDSCGVGLVVALDGKPRRDVVRGGHRCAEGGVAPRRGRCRRQDRRRRRHPCRDPAGLLRATMSRESRGHEPAGRAASPSAWCSCRAPTSARRSAAAPSSRPRSCASATRSRLAPGAGRHLGDRREGQRHAARDRADPDRPRRARARRPRVRAQLYIIRRRIEKAAIAENIGEFYVCSLSLPLGDLQGHVPGRAAVGLLSRPARRALRLALRDLPPALFDQHLPATGSWPSRSACSRTTARSTRCRATSTG